MHYVVAAKNDGDTCAYCGKPIPKGTVFIIKHVRGMADGKPRDAWLPVHLWCNAILRGATKEKLRTLPTVAAGHPIGDGIAVPVQYAEGVH